MPEIDELLFQAAQHLAAALRKESLPHGQNQLIHHHLGEIIRHCAADYRAANPDYQATSVQVGNCIVIHHPINQ